MIGFRPETRLVSIRRLPCPLPVTQNSDYRIRFISEEMWPRRELLWNNVIPHLGHSPTRRFGHNVRGIKT
jgi:hypothetical protein